MKIKAQIGALVLFAPFTVNAQTIQPYSMLEYLRTGALTVHENELSTEHGEAAKLELLFEKEDEYSDSVRYYKVINDGILVCYDATPADYISVRASSISTIVTGYKNQKNDSGTAYVEHCGDLLYE